MSIIAVRGQEQRMCIVPSVRQELEGPLPLISAIVRSKVTQCHAVSFLELDALDIHVLQAVILG